MARIAPRQSGAIISVIRVIRGSLYKVLIHRWL